MKVETADFVRSVVDEDGLVDDERPQVAFVGRSNVGKSSLLNRLLQRKALARISSTPGRTRAINYFSINDNVYFVDLPGYGYARVAKSERQAWSRLIAAYLRQIGDRARVIQIVDAKVGATKLDIQAFEYLRSHGQRPLVAATKIDRLSRAKALRAVEEIRGGIDKGETAQVVAVSARTGTGVRELWTEIDRFLAASLSSSRRGVKA